MGGGICDVHAHLTPSASLDHVTAGTLPVTSRHLALHPLTRYLTLFTIPGILLTLTRAYQGAFGRITKAKSNTPVLCTLVGECRLLAPVTIRISLYSKCTLHKPMYHNLNYFPTHVLTIGFAFVIYSYNFLIAPSSGLSSMLRHLCCTAVANMKVVNKHYSGICVVLDCPA